MSASSLRVVALLLAGLMGSLALTPSGYLTQSDRTRLAAVFEEALAGSTLASLSNGLVGQHLLGLKLPSDACQKLQAKADGADSLSDGYLAATAGAAAGCKVKLPAKVAEAVKKALSSGDSLSDLYHATLTQASSGNKVDGAAVVKSLQSALRKEDSPADLGMAFHAAAAAGADAKAVFDRVEDAVVQADEVDGKMLQFDGGLSVTSLVVTGAYALADKTGKPPLSKDQAVKFANYFLGRRSVLTSKGGVALLRALTKLTDNTHHIPVAVTLAGPAFVSDSSPKVAVRVTNLLGKQLSGKLDVSLESAMRRDDGAVVLANQKMAALSGTTTDYQVDLAAAKPGKGFYELTVSAAAAGANANRYVGNTGAVVTIKAIGSVNIENVEIGVGDADQTLDLKMNKVSHPEKLEKPLDADNQHRILLKFAIKDESTGKKTKAHQTFVRLVHAASGQEMIFVAEPNSNLVYKFDLDLSAKGKDFGGKSGRYEAHLIVGDVLIKNPISWHVADLNLKFGEAEAAATESSASPNEKKPEIRHLFRQPDPRPPATVSLLFTALSLAPWLILIVGWTRVGVNISNFPLSLGALGFHAGLGAIFGLYYYFWCQLDMFTTVKYLLGVGIVTFLCGHSLLVRLAEKRKL